MSVAPGLRADALEEGSAPTHQPPPRTGRSKGSILEPGEHMGIHYMTREAACPAPLCSSKDVPPTLWLSAGLEGSRRTALESKALPCRQRPSRGCRHHGRFASLRQSQPGTARTPGTGSTCQAPPRAQPSVRAASASSWPPKRTGQAKINSHLAGAAALRSLLREEAVLASAGSSLPRAGSGRRRRPRRSPRVEDRRGDSQGSPNPSDGDDFPTPLKLAAGLCREGWSAAPLLGRGA